MEGERKEQEKHRGRVERKRSGEESKRRERGATIDEVLGSYPGGAK